MIENVIVEAGLFVEYSTVIGTDKSLEEVYNERSDLRGIEPERGYIYEEWPMRATLRKYKTGRY